MSNLQDIYQKFGVSSAFDEVERRLELLEAPTKHTKTPGFSHDRAMHILRRLLIRLIPHGEQRVREIGIEEAFKEATGILDMRDRRVASHCICDDDGNCVNPAHPTEPAEAQRVGTWSKPARFQGEWECPPPCPKRWAINDDSCPFCGAINPSRLELESEADLEGSKSNG